MQVVGRSQTWQWVLKCLVSEDNKELSYPVGNFLSGEKDDNFVLVLSSRSGNGVEVFRCVKDSKANTAFKIVSKTQDEIAD